MSSRRLLCTSCNTTLGAKIDAPLANSLASIRYTLAVRSGDGAPPPVLRALESELGPIDLGLGSMRRSRAPGVEIRPGETGFDFKTNARTIEEAAIQTVHAARQGGIKTVTELLARLQLPADMMLLKTPLSQPVTLPLSIGDPEHFRSIAKTGLEVFAMLYPVESRDSACDDFREYVECGGGPEGRATWSFNSSLFLRAPPSFGAMSHSVVVFGHPGQPVVAHVCIFGWLWFVVRIADRSPVAAPFCGFHSVDPLVGQSQGIQRLPRVPPLALLQLFDDEPTEEKVNAHLAGFVTAAKQAGRPRHMAALLEAELEARGETPETLTPNRLQELCDQLVERELRGPRVERTEPIDPEAFRRLVVQHFEKLAAKE